MNNERSNNNNNNQSNTNSSNPQSSESASDDNNPYGDEYHEANVIDEKVPQVRAKVKVGEINHVFNSALLDSGGSRTLIARSRIPTHMTPKISKNPFPAVGSSGTRTHQESLIFE